nr:hypothetical protein [Tanacetum cinerariifolium]
MDQPNPTFSKILILDTGKFEQWKFRIQQYLQNEHYALWEVIKFGDSYKAPQEQTCKGPASESSAKKKGRTVVITTKDMQKMRNDVKERTTLLLALPDEHQLRFSKYETAKELWEAILKTFGGNEATKKTKKNQLKQYEKGEVHTASTQVSTASTDVAAANISQDTIDEDDIEEMDIKWNMALLSMRADWFWKKIGKKITIQGSDVAGFDKSKVECFNCHKIGHLARECRAPRSQDRGKRESYKQGPKEEEPAPKALMAIDGIGWDWSYMANEEENHALVADDEALTEFALMAKSSSSSEKEDWSYMANEEDHALVAEGETLIEFALMANIENKVFDNSLCSKDCKKNTDSLNSNITELKSELSDSNNYWYSYKLRVAQLEERLNEYKYREEKYIVKIKTLEMYKESKLESIKILTNEEETLKEEKDVVDGKLTRLLKSSKDLENIIET